MPLFNNLSYSNTVKILLSLAQEIYQQHKIEHSHKNALAVQMGLRALIKRMEEPKIDYKTIYSEFKRLVASGQQGDGLIWKTTHAITEQLHVIAKDLPSPEEMDERKAKEELEEKLQGEKSRQKEDERVSQLVEQKFIQLREKWEEEKKISYDEGYSTGQQALMIDFQNRVQQLPIEYRKPFLMILSGKMDIKSIESLETSGKQEKRVREEQDDKKKAEKWIGKPKFSAVELLVDFHNKCNIELEKRIARLLIFQLMACKNTHKLQDICEMAQKFILTELGLVSYSDNFQQYFNKIIQLSEESKELIQEKNPLSFEEARVFRQLLDGNNDTLYLPKDISALNYFKVLEAVLDPDFENKPKLMSIDEYRANFLARAKGLMRNMHETSHRNSQSSANKDSVDFRGNNPAI